jgi:hypothetical protein
MATLLSLSNEIHKLHGELKKDPLNKGNMLHTLKLGMLSHQINMEFLRLQKEDSRNKVYLQISDYLNTKIIEIKNHLYELKTTKKYNIKLVDKIVFGKFGLDMKIDNKFEVSVAVQIDRLYFVDNKIKSDYLADLLITDGSGKKTYKREDFKLSKIPEFEMAVTFMDNFDIVDYTELDAILEKLNK